jgi:hypothetical protein
MKRKKQQELRVIRLFEVLKELKENGHDKDYLHVRQLLRDYSLSNVTTTALKHLNIYTTVNGFNEKIPVTMRLAKAVDEKTQEINRSYVKKKTDLNNETIVVKPRVKRGRKPKMIVTFSDKKSPVSTVRKVGLIRRFLRWIY